MVMEYILFFTARSWLLDFIFHEMNEKSKDALPIERRLYNPLVINDYSVRTPVKYGPCRIDFVIGRLAIECDGKAYHSSPTQKAHDRKKDAYLRKQGYKVMRVSGSSILKRMPEVLKRVKTRLNFKKEKAKNPSLFHI
ncbi:endonuclease domain-containing protein [Priestia megaterium]|jgi:very-short-patch-repair endonuclease|uniref:endonuclease domain-containing protein n=1 Tax=Priestia megaterium TaxID=1404 RepID=UPI00285EEE98|nr:DUF559 domain-containing protein [Priestia megaterium]MDR7247107.1 very-short-patch-repair endonuclease [Priestia megaterium]